MVRKYTLLLVILIIFSSCQNKQNNLNKKVTNNILSLPTVISDSNLNISEQIDFDLSKMSSTMVYAEVFNMLINSEEYENKVIKVKGNFDVFFNEEKNEKYFAIVIPDATACCQQGIEFIWIGNHKYPDDYPKIGQEITVVGKYSIALLEGDISYNYLQVSNIEY